jgi:hypothetical protein
MTQGLGSERSPVACIPRVAVESGGRGVAGQTHVRRWPRTTRCNELAVIVIRDSELVGRESLIAPFGEEEHGRSEVSLRAVSLISNHLGDDATALCGIPIECLLLVDRVHQGTQE